MTTPRIRSLVSLAVAVALAVTIGGCASAPLRETPDGIASADGLAHTVRFDNEGRDYVHVYLIAARQEWHLGRVAPGARTTLRIPDAALDENAGLLRLAVLTSDRVTMRAAANDRAATTIARPAAEVLSQRWAFSQLTATGQLMPLSLGVAGRP